MNNAPKPKVSIVIPVYNGANFMVQAIESALLQTYSNIEILVINDGSKDNGETERIARSYEDKIKYYHKENGGVASALNCGIKNMTGEYFSWLSHDDMYAPEKIQEQIAALSEYDPTAIAYSDYIAISNVGEVVKQYKLSEKSRISMRCFLALDVDTGLHGCSLLIPRLLFEKYGFFDETLKCTQDYDLWFRFAREAQFVHVNNMLVFSRQHAEQDSKTKSAICTSEADVFHAKAIDDLSSDEINLYTNGSTLCLLPIYKTYKNAGYHLTATSLLRVICRHVMSQDDMAVSAEILRDLIFVVEEKLAQNYLESIIKLLSAKEVKPTIVLYNNVWFKGGVERFISIITSYLEKEYNIVLITLESNNGFELHPNVYHFNIGNGTDYVDRIVDLTTFIKADIFIGNPNIFVEFLSIYEALHARGIKSIACNHSYYFVPLWRPWLYSLFISRENAFESANVVTWLTSFSSQIFSMSHSNSALMPNPLTFPVTEDAEQLQGHTEKIVLCVGRFYDTIKRLDRAIKVFAEVLKEHSDAKLCLVGGYDLDISTDPCSDTSVRELINSLNIPDANIEFAGEQSSVEQYYREASVLILTSDMEGFGMVLAEAGAHGVPAVIFEIPGLEDIITDGVNGYIVPQDDINSMAHKVSYLLSDEVVRKSMGNHAKSMVKRFDQQAIADRWRRLIDLLLTNDDQKKIEEILKTDFMPAMPDNEAFTRRVVSLYNGYMCQVIKARPGQLEEHKRHLEDFRIQCEGLNQQLHAVLNSWSWKITKPLRSILTFLIGR
jgi:glycosyltransferase involved in cell wall biosynthesis